MTVYTGMTAYQVHQKAKAAAEEARNARSRVESVPEEPPFEGTAGDLNYAAYWADRALAHAVATDHRLGELGYPQ
jgi:hypothetical protein